MAFFQDRWDDNDVEKLIKLIQVHPCLWNGKSHDYKNLEARESALNEISRRMGILKEEARKKYRNLRTQYVREIRNSKLRGYHSRWIFFNSLKFLSEGEDSSSGLWDPLNSDDTQEEVDTIQNTTEIYNTDLDDDQYAEEFLDATEGVGEEEDTNEVDYDHIDDVNVDYETAPPSKKRRHYLNYESRQDEPIFTGVQKNSQKRPTVLVMKTPRKLRDEHTIFGEHVANELRLLKNQKDLQQTLKCTILTAILDINKTAHESNLS